MKKVLISQRHDKIPEINEWRDSLDNSWSFFVHELNLIPILAPNNEKILDEFLIEMKPDYVILSGGNDVDFPHKRKAVEQKILKYSINHNLPVVGVCHGMQFLNYYFDGTLIACTGHVNNYIALEGLWAIKRNISKINSFHDFGINKSSISSQFKPLAWSKDGIIKAFKHKSLPWLGIMWHPERELPFKSFDIALFKDFFNI